MIFLREEFYLYEILYIGSLVITIYNYNRKWNRFFHNYNNREKIILYLYKRSLLNYFMHIQQKNGRNSGGKQRIWTIGYRGCYNLL